MAGSPTADDAPGREYRAVSTRSPKQFFLAVTLTTAGAVLSNDSQSDQALTIVKNGGTTGQYDLTFPATPGEVYLDITFISPANTISQWSIKTISQGAGTASIILYGPTGTAAYGASGDRILTQFTIDARKDV